VSRSHGHGHSDHDDVLAHTGGRPARDGGPPRPVSSPSGLLALQASAGNRAVAGLLRSAAQGITVQRATVSGVTNAGKSATQIGTDVHRLVQDAFLDSHLGNNYNLYTEFAAGPGFADMVAIKDEREDDGTGDMWIYVGEIKSAADQYYAGGRTHHQLATYIAALKVQYPHAYVGRLTSWNTDADGYPLHGNGYNCTVYVANAGQGLYRYSGRVTEEGRTNQSNRIEDEGHHQLPFNEQPNYLFS
jgi:hypothetical protein